MDIISLFEAPIEDLNLIGNWSRNSSFRKEQDRKILTNPKVQAQVIHKWRNTKFPFNMYFVNSPEAGHYTEVGEVTEDWLREKMPKTYPSLRIRDDAINIIYTNNKGDERVPMTAWVIAHRLGHAFMAQSAAAGISSFTGMRPISQFTDMVDQVYEVTSSILAGAYGITGMPRKEIAIWRRERSFLNLYKNFFQKIGTMRSARNKNIRAYFEFPLELLAQYIISNRVRFNHLPQSFIYHIPNQDNDRPKRHYAVLTRKQHDVEYYNGMLDDLANGLPDFFDDMMRAGVGRIFVM